VHFYVLVNGTPYGFVNSSFGLRQGDILFPLCVVVREGLSRMLSATVDRGLLSGFLVGSRGTICVSSPFCGRYFDSL
jgi:hypothetical protein